MTYKRHNSSTLITAFQAAPSANILLIITNFGTAAKPKSSRRILEEIINESLRYNYYVRNFRLMAKSMESNNYFLKDLFVFRLGYTRKRKEDFGKIIFFGC